MDISCVMFIIWQNSSFFFLIYSLSSFSTFSFWVFVTLDNAVSFSRLLQKIIYNLMRAAELVLYFPDKTSVCTHTLGTKMIKCVFTMPLNLTTTTCRVVVLVCTSGVYPGCCLNVNENKFEGFPKRNNTLAKQLQEFSYLRYKRNKSCDWQCWRFKTPVSSLTGWFKKSHTRIKLL